MARATIGTNFYYRAGTSTVGDVTFDPGALTEWQTLQGVLTDIPETSGSVNAIQSTPIDEKEFHRYVSGLKDSGGAQDYTANVGNAERTEFKALLAAQAASPNGTLDICYFVDGDEECGYITGTITDWGYPAVTVDSLAQVTFSVTPQRLWGWLPVPTTTTP